MMTAMERSISPYEERGSEASMADSLGIKNAAKESSKGLNYDDTTYVHGALGVDPYACLEVNLAGFKPMRRNHEKFTCEEVVLWLQTLSRKSKCGSLFWCAEEYAQRFVVDGEMHQGRFWLRAAKKYWLAVMKEVAGCDGREHYDSTMRFWSGLGLTELKGIQGDLNCIIWRQIYLAPKGG